MEKVGVRAHTQAHNSAMEWKATTTNQLQSLLLFYVPKIFIIKIRSLTDTYTFEKVGSQEKNAKHYFQLCLRRVKLWGRVDDLSQWWFCPQSHPTPSTTKKKKRKTMRCITSQKTSSPAPPHCPDSSARKRAASSMMPPRAQFTTRTPFLHLANTASLIRSATSKSSILATTLSSLCDEVF